MNNPAPPRDTSQVTQVDARPAVCLAAGCGGTVVRHSLGGGVAVARCTRCFKRYELRRPEAAAHAGPLPGAPDDLTP